ncbi:hypothetical protein EJ02DRAFT_389236 [Clathrospora elynae]|uniref:Telomeric single stranded DNA binding POT1/Cdc13 domain-containing protein n=1 Tax=Clathrospora elynae TaxID=706981 RepID=A0A6A5S7L8_9PLEO|nr:hypothetical protein EJ02DRAFT_389236 [Clathrospora elynae]
MEQLHIAELNPELPAVESKQFRATVTLIWPYSSSARQFALLLAEPDFRLRRKNGQVRARFSEASAKAIATTGVGIGDEVVMSLRGAQFVTEGAVNTPGKSIAWELSYTDTVVLHVFRNGSEIANLDVVDVAPTPAPQSPVRREFPAGPSPAHQYSTPAFLKRARLSNGPFFETPFDPLAGENENEDEEGHAKKRRRKSYRDWKAWTYSGRTPSPEKEDAAMEVGFGFAESSPSRAAQLPVDDVLRDADYYELYAGPDEFPPSDAQYAFGGDTEVDTEANTDEEGPVQGEPDVVIVSTTESNTEEQNEELDRRGTESVSDEESMVEVMEVRQATQSSLAVMPLPTLTTLQAGLPTSVTGAVLAPLGREPASPTLKPLDSATLPLPSPFPEERDTNVTSYLDHFATTQQPADPDAEVAEEQDPPSEASYILETSFFNSIGSSKPNHESAFTPVRFTFGMDGTGFSRPMELSSPEPHVEETAAADFDVVMEEPEVTALSSDSEPDDSQVSDAEVETDEEKSDAEDIEEAADGHLPIYPEHDHDADEPPSTRQSAAASAIIDLSSPSENDSDDEELIPEVQPIGDVGHEHDNLQPMSSIRNSPIPDDHQEVSPQHQDQLPSMDLESHSEFVNLDFATEDSNAMISAEERTVTHTPPQELEISVDFPRVGQPPSIDDYEPQLALGDSDDCIQDAFSLDGSTQVQEWDSRAGEDRHPDIKMESVEEDALYQIGHSDTQNEQSQVSTELSDELPIAVPEEGYKLVELQTISVPATGPARNTRSKTKTSMSPTKEETPASGRTARAKTSVTYLDHTDVSPPRKRTRSTLSPLQNATQTSPHSLRSQSKLLSSTKSMPNAAAATRRSPRKHALHGSINSMSDAGPPQVEDRDPIFTSFEPSQELGASQGIYSNVAFVKDSEEESIRSERSISTVHYSDDLGASGIQHTNYIDPTQQADLDEDDMDVKPPRATAPEAMTRPVAKTGWKRTDPKVVIELKSHSPARPDFSFITQPQVSSPNRLLRSAGWTEAASSSPRNVQRTKRHVHGLSSEPEEAVGELSGQATPRADQERDEVAYSVLLGGSQLRSSPPSHAQDIDELMRSSPPAFQHQSNNKYSAMKSTRPMTPEATQQTTTGSQTSFPALHHGQSSPMTPQLTQITPAGLRSFQVDELVPTPAIKTSPIAKSTPHPSSDMDSDTSPDRPSIGLSTPLAYYTPLKDLLYFLNRSSQFHSAANPDVLALVTSSTTPSEKAKKGPKHWNTTLHITDASSWPDTTTVNVFRAYQTALPLAEVGDVVLLRAFAVKSLNRHPMLISADESSWCVWRWGKPVWGANRGPFGEIRAREETKGPVVERGEGEWREVEKLRRWYMRKVKEDLEDKESSQVKTRGRGKGKEVDV